MLIDCNKDDTMPATTTAATARWLPLQQWEKQSPEERFNAAMRDSRLVDEANGFITDQDAAMLAAMVAAIYREHGEAPPPAAVLDIGVAYWTALIRAQRRVTRSVQ